MKVISVAVITALAATIALNQWEDYRARKASQELAVEKEKKPATDWFVVRNLAVGDGLALDNDLPVIYDREIKLPFYGRWYAEIRDVETHETKCYGNGASYYEPKDILPTAGVTLKWLMGKDCNLKKGQFYVEVNYFINPIGYPEKSYRAVSNVFTTKEAPTNGT